jgi:hypothetical protein
VWLARQDIAKKGFKPSTRQIKVFDASPTEMQEHDVRAACVKFQEEMYAFGHTQPKVFAGTIRALINAYQTDPDSPYQNARWHSRRGFDFHLARIAADHGDCRLADMGVRDFKRWYEKVRWPDGKEGRDKKSMAHGMITMVRMILSFGYSFEIEKVAPGAMSHCARLKLILHEVKFEKGKSRTESITLRQCEDVIAVANEAGLHSVALAQALQFDLRLRQKDVVGEYVPMSEPGISSITRKGRKWLRGICWEEISSAMILTHKISKSREGKVIEADLKNHPMIMAELEKIPVVDRVGPLIKWEKNGLPWPAPSFRGEWRRMATKAGIPAHVFNMDSRAGGITETIEATGGNLEAARKQAGHSDVKMTQRYSRRDLESNTETAAIVMDFRAKNKA